MSRMRVVGRFALTVGGVTLLSNLTLGCVVPRPDAKLPAVTRAFVAVMSGQMPKPIDEVSRHSWIVTHHSQSTRYRRFEMGGGSESDPFDDFAAGDVMLHGVIEMTDAELDHTEACLSNAEREYRQNHPDYFPIPGPNSNTLVAELLRKCSIRVELPSTAIGRDYVGPVGAAVTESGTGIQVGSIPLGLRLGLQEGVELQLFGLPFGAHFWPPGVTVPVNPGRIGFAADGHVQRPCRCYMDGVPETSDLGVGSVTMFARGTGVARPSLAGGLVGAGTVGMSARGVYGGRLGYGFGLDFEGGAAAPLGFAGSVHLFPVGIGYALGPTSFVGIFSGIGTSGVTSAVPSGVDLPQELRVELGVGRMARLAIVAQGSFVAAEPARRQGRLWFDETLLGAYARFGALKAAEKYTFASGAFFGLERRDVMATTALSVVVGTQIDASIRSRSPSGSSSPDDDSDR